MIKIRTQLFKNIFLRGVFVEYLDFYLMGDFDFEIISKILFLFSFKS